MPRNMKLTGLKSYTGAAVKPANMETRVINKGEVCRFSDDVADKVEQSGRFDKENEWKPYWTEVADDVVVNHNFSGDDVKEAPADLAKLAKENAPRAKAAPQRGVMRRSRAG